MARSDKSDTQAYDALKLISLTAVGVAAGMAIYHQLIRKLWQRNDQHDVNNIVNDQWEIPVIAVRQNGDSYIAKEYYKLQDKGSIGALSNEILVKSLKFRTTPGDYNYSWHNAPKLLFIINLDAAVHVTTSDGNSILLKQGQVFIVRDTTGKGHFSRSVRNLPRKSVFIAIE